jgi:hypothetical protein
MAHLNSTGEDRLHFPNKSMKATTKLLLLAILMVLADNPTSVVAQVIARYDAGLADGGPPVAPNLYEFKGQTWMAVLNTNTDVTVGPVQPDALNCVNAWNVSDNSTNAGLDVSYSFPLSPAIHASASSNGWEFSVMTRMITNFGSSTAPAGFFQFGNTNTQQRFRVHLGVNASGSLRIQLVGTNGSSFNLGTGTNYQTHEIVYSAATGTARYYVDGSLARSGWTGDYSSVAIHGPAFGVSSNAGKGSLNFSLVEFGVQPPGPVASALRYQQLGPEPQRVSFTWTAAPNTGGPGIKEYVVYRNGLEVKRTASTTFVDVYLLPCHRYDYTVVTVDTNGTAYAPSLPLRITSLPPASITGTRNIKVILLNFPDYPNEPFTTNAAYDLVFNSSNSVNAFFQENSYGRLTLQGDVAGWYTLPQAASNYCSSLHANGMWYVCNTTELREDALSVLPPDQTNNLASYEAILLVYEGVGTPGLAGGIYKYFSASNGFRLSVIAHELGHGVDRNQNGSMLHASGWNKCTAYSIGPDLLDPNSNCGVSLYGDNYDIMAAANTFHFSMFHKEMFGFLLPSNIQVADQDGNYTLHAAEIATNAVQMIKIPLEHEMFYFLEYRTLRGFDGPTTPEQSYPLIDGVLIRLRCTVDPGGSIDTIRPNIVLNPGTPFIDPYRGVRIEVTQKLGDHVIVNVSGTGKPLKLTGLQLTGAGNQDVRLAFDSVAGAKYLIQSTTNLSSWLIEQTNVVASAASTTNLLPGASTGTNKFFRVGIDSNP